jgi:hypothetical protein
MATCFLDAQIRLPTTSALGLVLTMEAARSGAVPTPHPVHIRQKPRLTMVPALLASGAVCKRAPSLLAACLRAHSTMIRPPKATAPVAVFMNCLDVWTRTIHSTRPTRRTIRAVPCMAAWTLPLQTSTLWQWSRRDARTLCRDALIRVHPITLVTPPLTTVAVFTRSLAARASHHRLPTTTTRPPSMTVRASLWSVVAPIRPL